MIDDAIDICRLQTRGVYNENITEMCYSINGELEDLEMLHINRGLGQGLQQCHIIGSGVSADIPNQGRAGQPRESFGQVWPHLALTVHVHRS